MDEKEAMKSRHAVRSFKSDPLKKEAVEELEKAIAEANKESGLNIQLKAEEPEAFQASKPSYGNFKGCKNYLLMVGPKGEDEKIGYYGEKLVLKAQCLGINSCWVALTYKKGKAEGDIPAGEKKYMVIALGYGENQGVTHKIKTLEQVSDYKAGDPDWYKEGLEAALLAPTAMNQQKFHFERDGEKVKAKAGFGFYTKTDLGIAKYNFEVGSGKDHTIWED
ncbi:MAG: nitroreductase family protein [Eubacteriales bacterium]|nr:nitroreductase family protein [Eubacteriales bacterium]